jgi:hypothetical protein
MLINVINAKASADARMCPMANRAQERSDRDKDRSVVSTPH